MKANLTQENDMKPATWQCNIKVIEEQSNYVWVRGTSGRYRFDAKVYRTGSDYGIRKGRVSKLTVWIDADRSNRQSCPHWIAIYDRGWDIRPQKKYRRFVEYIIRLLDALPPEDLEPPRKEDPC